LFGEHVGQRGFGGGELLLSACVLFCAFCACWIAAVHASTSVWLGGWLGSGWITVWHFFC
jgi:hypothetical protein